jgi:signal transduction histidine kinase
MEIRTRLTVQFFLISSALLLLAFLTIYFFYAKIQKEEFFLSLESRAKTTADLLIRVEQIDSTLLKVIDLNKKDVLDFENISVYDVNGKEIYTNNDTIHFSELLPDFDLFLDEVIASGKQEISDGDFDFVGIQYQNASDKFVVVACAVDTKGIKNLRSLRRVLALVFFSVIAIIVLAGWIYSGRALKPISTVIDQVNSISANNLNQRISAGSNKDEIARLTLTFNHLLDRIEDAFTTQKTFVSNASHELRNPLTAITSQLEVTLLKARNVEEYEEIISSVLEDIRDLNEMSHRLLVLAKIDGESNSFKFESLRLDDLIWETKNEFLAQNTSYFVTLTLNKLPENEKQLLILGNRHLLKTCFVNLMDNACKFSSNHGVSIEIFSDIKTLTIQFADKGTGISKSELPHIFEPFYRAKNSAEVSGYGVGLSIVQKIVHLHNAKIEVASTLSVGTKISIVFPLV